MHPSPAVSTLSRQSFTAYSVYFQEERRRLLGQDTATSTHGSNPHLGGKTLRKPTRYVVGITTITQFEGQDSHFISSSSPANTPIRLTFTTCPM